MITFLQLVVKGEQCDCFRPRRFPRVAYMRHSANVFVVVVVVVDSIRPTYPFASGQHAGEWNNNKITTNAHSAASTLAQRPCWLSFSFKRKKYEWKLTKGLTETRRRNDQKTLVWPEIKGQWRSVSSGLFCPGIQEKEQLEIHTCFFWGFIWSERSEGLVLIHQSA